MDRHLHLVHSAKDLVEDESVEGEATHLRSVGTNVVDLGAERRRRRQRYHPSAGRAWLDNMFDDDLDPVC